MKGITMKVSDILIFCGLALAFISGGLWSLPCIMIFGGAGIALLWLGVALQDSEEDEN